MIGRLVCLMKNDVMNFLYGSLPSEIVINGVKYSIYTDFRNWVQIEIILSEGYNIDSITKVIMLCYKVLPPSINHAIKGILDFYAMGKTENNKKGECKNVIYSFEYDSEYIYSAFWECYGVDLLTADLHWWQFKTLFINLGKCRFTKIMQYRALDLTSVKNKEQKSFYKKMKRLYRLPKMGEADVGGSIEKMF